MDLDALLEEAAELTLREISPGQEVKVHDLKRRSDLNEQLAIVQRQLQNGRLEVRIVLTGLIISISRENAAITAPAPASAAGTAVGCQTSIPISTATLSMNPSPFVWANKNFFYPFGNTPAKSLLQHIPADQACARLLLLGCGDSRHLLFSAYCAQRAGGLAAQQSLSLVMCDIIPSVMARNIVLYKLLLDGVEGAVVWSLFYSKVVDRNCVHALLTCAASLLSLGPTLAAWHDTPFGSVVRFCDEGSFRLVREVWAVYARGEVADKQKVEMFKKSQQRECEKMGYDFETNMLITAAQQATPVALMSAMKNSKEHSDLAKEYIRVGATPACIRNTGAGAGAGAGTGAGTGVTGPGTLCNPMMLEGPEQGVTLHYALDPTCGFHLAAAYLAPHTGATTAISTTGPGADDGSVDRDAIYMTCFRQFSEWGAALACMLRASVYGDSSSDTITSTGTGSGASVGRIEIWTFAGDAGDCCQAISSRCTEGAGKGTEVGAGAGAGTGSPPPFLPSHSLRPLNFHPAAPAKFDFIDSSNIGDSLGLLNVLCTCTPLLAPGLHSVISTDILSTSLANTGRVDLFLEELLHCDLATFATLTGLTLSESCLRNSCSFKHIEQNIRLLVTTQKSDSKLQRLSTTLEWHCISTQPLSPTPTPTPTPTPIPTPTPTPTLATISSPDFVALFMSIYRRMFESSMGVSCTDRAMEHLVTQMQGQNVFSKPTVQTFCRLLCAAMARCAVDVGSAGAGGCEGVGAGAGDVVVQLLEQIRFSGYLVQGQYTQEVAVWLHLLGLLSYEALETFVQQSAPLTAKGKAQFLRWWGTSTAPAAIITPTTPTTASLTLSSTPTLTPPPLLLLTLLVPVRDIQRLSAMPAVLLEMTVESAQCQSFFSSFHMGHVKRRIGGLSAGSRTGAGAGVGAGANAEEVVGGLLTLNNFNLVGGSARDDYVSCSVLVTLPCVAHTAQSEISVGLRVATNSKSLYAARTLVPELLFRPLSCAKLTDTSRVSWCAYSAERHKHMLPVGGGYAPSAPFAPPLPKVPTHLQASALSSPPTPPTALIPPTPHTSTVPPSPSSTTLTPGPVTVSPLRATCISQAASALSTTAAVAGTTTITHIDSYTLTLTFNDPQHLANRTATLLDLPHPQHLRVRLFPNSSANAVVKGSQSRSKTLLAVHAVEAAEGYTHYDLYLPAVVDISKAKIQISKKRGVLILALPTVRGLDACRRTVHMFREIVGVPPRMSPSMGGYALFGAPRALLECMPKICPVGAKHCLQDLSTHVSAQLSKEERAGDGAHKTAVVSMKETIHALAMNSLGHNNNTGKRHSLTCLQSPSCGGEVAVFINCIRLDCSLGRLVLDAAVCVLDQSNVQLVAGWITEDGQASGGMHSTNVTDAEMVLWKKALPALVERTRNDWTHGPECEYLGKSSDSGGGKGSKAKGRAKGSKGEVGGGNADAPTLIPLSSHSMGTKVVCSCGLGRGLQGTEFSRYRGGSAARVMGHFSRAAISPLFSSFEAMPGM